jgi:Ser/Thr protein kinase RdoA (MazF antagonist)
MKLNKCLALSLLQQSLPQNNIQTIENISQLTGGITNKIYLAQTNNGKYILKVFEPNNLDPSIVLSKAEVAKLLCQLRMENVYVPDVHAFHDNFHGKQVMIMEYIENKNDKHENNLIFNVGASLALFHRAGQKLTQFHKEPNDVKSLASELFQSAKRAISNFSIFAEAKYTFNLLMYAIKTLKYKAPPLTKGLTHHDIHPGNFILDSQGKLALIDFELCRHDFLINDLAHAALMYCFDNVGFNENKFFKLLKGYSSIRALSGHEIHFLYTTALQDRAELELISQSKLHNMSMPYGSPFQPEHYKQLNNWLQQTSFQKFFNRFKNEIIMKQHASISTLPRTISPTYMNHAMPIADLAEPKIPPKTSAKKTVRFANPISIVFSSMPSRPTSPTYIDRLLVDRKTGETFTRRYRCSK